MHAQIRTKPARSPANLAELLQVLKDAGINIEAAGGSNIEQGGEFAFAVAHGQEDKAIAILEEERYKPRLVRPVHNCVLDERAWRAAAVHHPRRSTSNEATGPQDQGHRGRRAHRGRPDPGPDLLRRRRGTSRAVGTGGRPEPTRAPIIAAPTRFATPSLSRMWVTWTAAVLRVMNRRSAISPLDRPAVTSSSTSTSRADSPSAIAAAACGSADGVAGAAAAGSDADRPR